MSLTLLGTWSGPVPHELYQDDKHGEGRGAWICTCGARTPCQHHLEAQAKAAAGLLSNHFRWAPAGLDLATRCRCAGAEPVALTPEPPRGIANVAQGVGGLSKNRECPCGHAEGRRLKRCTGDPDHPHPLGVPPGYGEPEIIGGGSPPRKPTKAEKRRERAAAERVERGRERIFLPSRIDAILAREHEAAEARRELARIRRGFKGGLPSEVQQDKIDAQREILSRVAAEKRAARRARRGAK